MARRGQSDLFLLLIVLLGFSASMAFFMSNIHPKQRSERVKVVLATDIDDVTAIKQISPLLYAHAVDHVAREIFIVAQADMAAIKRLVQYAIDLTSSPLNKTESAQLLVGILYYAVRQKMNSVSDVLSWTTNQDVFKDLPILFVIAQSPYASLLADPVLQHLKENSNACFAALKTAVANNDCEVALRLFQAGIRIDATQATMLLAQAAAHNRHTAFIKLFMDQNADPNAFYDERTFLIMATEHNNIDMVKELMAYGADPKISSENASIGTPEQIAFERGYVEIEKLLHDDQGSSK